MAEADQHDGRRPSIEKRPLTPDVVEPQLSAFERLPDEIIQQILQLTDPNTFASLVLLNPKWRNASQRAHLYALQLSSCPSYAASHRSDTVKKERDLPELRRLFAREVKRNLFEAYRRPSQTVIKIISNSISSSSCPGGEGIQFSPSPKGHHLLAYNSSRIYVIDMRCPEIAVKRELKILRRPAATCIKDDGSLLAVLLTEMQVDLYDLTPSPPKRTQSLILDHSPRDIALSPCGSVLAAAYEGGIEVSSLNPGALASDRRSVKCDAVDALAFSFDGTQILGTTVHSTQPSTVILTAPYYDPGSHMENDNISAMWTTSILFPNTSRDCSHAVLLQDSSHEEASWTFTYDRSFETFRAVRIDDLRNGTTYFTGPIPSAASQGILLPCTLPSTSYRGELVSAGFQGKEVWLYGVPEDLDAVPDSASTSLDSNTTAGNLGRRNSALSTRSPPRTQETGETRVPQWQVLCDKFRNTFIAGFKVAELDGVNTVKWVAGFGNSSLKERLVVAARGVLPPKPITEEDGIDFVDGGRITLLDFDYGVQNGRTTEITIEVGTKEPEVLEEEHRDLDTEVAIVRRRTVAQKRGTRSAVMRAATTAARPPPLPPAPQPREDDADDPLVPRRIGTLPPRRTEQPAVVTEDPETQSIIEEQEALDAPYSHASPRSGTTLRRAATAAAINRRLHPPTAAAAGHMQYRRADGRAEHPHESDADNWVPPPPPYQKEDPGDLPAFLRHAATTVTGSTVPPPLSESGPSSGEEQQTLQSSSQPAQSAQSHPAEPEIPLVGQQPPAQVPQPASQPPLPQNGSSHERETSALSAGASRHDDSVRPVSQSTAPFQEDNIYDVSPPDSPRRQMNRPGPSSRNTSGGSDITNPGSGHGVVGSSPVTSSTAPSVPRILTSVGPSPSQEHVHAPVLDLHIPSPSMSNMTWSSQQSNESPAVRRLSNSQTWPRQPGHTGPPPAVLPAGYPYSAPPTDINASEMIAQSYPPAPRPDQLQSLNSREGHRPDSRRLSGGFQVQRVPVGSRDPDRLRRLSGQQQQRYSYQATQQQQQLQHPQPQRPYQQHQPSRSYTANHDRIGPVPLEEDQPLIISTPKGVSGAYDPPNRQTSGRRAEPQILAPVPRHPRPAALAGVAVRPTVERLETIYSVHSNPTADQPSYDAQAPPAPQPYHHQPPQPHPVGPALLSPGPASSSSAHLSAPSTSTVRHSSLSRRQSRAERSAAKNMADAKRRGWGGRSKSNKAKKGKKKKERDADAASSAAWTDVTWSSAGAGAGAGGGVGKDKKCVVM
ncbi:F-box domain-containing protein [Pleurostoma richardsiae]|uniref:F-box domain-containing protein n=1 Tax=Pleurostoma richardsiae TaxID=41990 RepID=A0AA38VY16_9PEZI|nr:F-box domain-containing protein [Pleurostoma richardsiae]